MLRFPSFVVLGSQYSSSTSSPLHQRLPGVGTAWPKDAHPLVAAQSPWDPRAGLSPGVGSQLPATRRGWWWMQTPQRVARSYWFANCTWPVETTKPVATNRDWWCRAERSKALGREAALPDLSSNHCPVARPKSRSASSKSTMTKKMKSKEKKKCAKKSKKKKEEPKSSALRCPHEALLPALYQGPGHDFSTLSRRTAVKLLQYHCVLVAEGEYQGRFAIPVAIGPKRSSCFLDLVRGKRYKRIDNIQTKHLVPVATQQLQPLPSTSQPEGEPVDSLLPPASQGRERSTSAESSKRTSRKSQTAAGIVDRPIVILTPDNTTFPKKL